MEGIFLEYENENSLRSYPFAAGCEPNGADDAGIPAGLFIDAAIYPVNPSGSVYLSEISDSGVFSISDSRGVIMKGEITGSCVEFHDMSAFARHSGTLVASSADALLEFAMRGKTVAFSRDVASFASSCVFPIVIDGVTSVSSGGSHVAGRLGFLNGPYDDVRVSSGKRDDGRSTLRFDVIPRPGVYGDSLIRRIICVVDGATPFRIDRLRDAGGNIVENAYNTVIVTLEGIDKETICAAAHRENAYEMTDTCECEKPDLPEQSDVPYTFQIEEVYIPPDEVPDGGHLGPEGGIEGGADNAFYLVVPNLSGYMNPLSITLEDGVVSPRSDEPEVTMNGDVPEIQQDVMVDEITSKGVVIQVPGLSGGQI